MNIVTEKMRQAGSNMASALMDAQISKCMGELDGSRDWEQFVKGHGYKNIDLIELYLKEKIESVTAIYLAMCREKE